MKNVEGFVREGVARKLGVMSVHTPSRSDPPSTRPKIASPKESVPGPKAYHFTPTEKGEDKYRMHTIDVADL
jgi:hypothetical protein